MKKIDYYSPVDIKFGCGRVNELGDIAAKYGKKAMLVSMPDILAMEKICLAVKASLENAGIDFIIFDGVISNPTTDSVYSGATMAREHGIDVVIGLGGGSAVDTAKAIAVEATHEGTCWDYLHYTDGPTENTLPIIAVSTTAGTGSEVTPCAVITKTENKDKSAIWHKNIIPKVAIVDPELTVTAPRTVTAQTGFDAFAHNFEAFISRNSNAYIEILALDAIKRVYKYLPLAIENGDDMEARSQMSWSATLGGLTISSAGVTLPHGLGMQVGGHCPHVTHGQALAAIYPEFTRFTYTAAVEKFAAVGRILDSSLENETDEVAAKQCCEAIDNFLKKINLWIGFEALNVTERDLRDIANNGQVLDDYKNNPRIANIDEMYDLLKRSYKRQ